MFNLMLIQDEIEEELANINNLISNLQNIKNMELEKEIKKRLFASILDDFYLATEKIFKTIARDIDEKLPEGQEWHKQLLRQMSIKIAKTRPSVIDKKLFHQLEEYLRFRHLVRNIYGFQLEIDRFEHLLNDLSNVADKLESQVLDFLSLMEKIVKEIEN
jgi:hypothetical protein